MDSGSRLLSKHNLRRFWGNVPIDRSDACWPYAGHIASHGYGVIATNHGSYTAHRLMRELIDGKPVPAGMVVCHSCDNRPCVNPNHLWIGTHSENSRDMVAKGRGPALKPRCRRGHDYTPENYWMTPAGARRCRTCNRARRDRQRASEKVSP